MTDISSRGYANPDVLVTTDWVAEHLSDPDIRIVESNEDPLLYPSGHLPGAVNIDWAEDLNHPLRRDYLDKSGFEALMARNGIGNNTTVIFYGDKNNWWATYALWVFQLFGHDKAKVMDGGRVKWEKEGRDLTKEVPTYPAATYKAKDRDDSKVRIFQPDVLKHQERSRALVDVRSPEEYRGERTHMAEYPQEGVLRGGHIPGARNVPWARAANPEDGTFKTAAELRAIYEEEQGLDPKEDIVTYCRIGERSSHTWFALTYLLGYKNVRNYDGSWTEWGNSVNVPVER